MSLPFESWLLIPLIILVLTGILCPAVGTVLITHKRLLQVNLISHSVLPGLALATTIGIDPTLVGKILIYDAMNHKMRTIQL